MLRTLAVTHTDAHCELDFTTPLELAVATILSAQSTDVRVNQVTPALFARYRTALDYAQADRAELEELIHSTGFFRNKADVAHRAWAPRSSRSTAASCRTRLDELVALPGIGRKTANVILGNAFGVPGITVDTHFGRLVRRWGWTEEEDPVKVEHAIGALVPKRDWTIVSHQVIFHGRRVCHARKPACGACTLAADCPSFGPGPTDARAGRRAGQGPGPAAPARPRRHQPTPRPRPSRGDRSRPDRGAAAAHVPTSSHRPAVVAAVLVAVVVVALLALVAARRPAAHRGRARPPRSRRRPPGRRLAPLRAAAALAACPAAERRAGGRPAGRGHRHVPRRRAPRRSRRRSGRPARAGERVGVLVRARAGPSCRRWPSTPPAPGAVAVARARRAATTDAAALAAARRARRAAAVGHRPGRTRRARRCELPPGLPASYLVRADGSVVRVDPPTPFASRGRGGRRAWSGSR